MTASDEVDDQQTGLASGRRPGSERNPCVNQPQSSPRHERAVDRAAVAMTVIADRICHRDGDRIRTTPWVPRVPWAIRSRRAGPGRIPPVPAITEVGNSLALRCCSS